MRKLWIVLLALIVLTLQACDALKDYDEEILSLESTVLNQIPDYINADFEIELESGYDVTFKIADQTYQDVFQYVAPFYDSNQLLEVTVKRGTSEKTFQKDVTLLSRESGYQETKIYLQVPNGIDSIEKEVYQAVEVKVETIKNGELVVEHQTNEAKIRGRGNSTWFSYEKKPYRLRFDKNTSILGMPEAKNYVLLAEYADKSLIRNILTQKMASLFSNLDPLEVRPVELYINNEYRGYYVLTEQVENHPNKLALNAVPGVANTDYLFELDMRFYEQEVQTGYDWFLVDRHAYQIKDPDPDEITYTNVHAAYLEEQLYALENALINQEGYQDLLDVDNAIDFFLIHEISKNVDVGWSSVFMIKKQDGPFMYAPLWDFDFAYGNADYIDYGPENWYGMREWKNRMFILMMGVPELRLKFKERFMYYEENILPQLEQFIIRFQNSISEMGIKNFERWPILETYIWPNPTEMMERHSHALQVEYVYLYLLERSAWMKEELGSYAYSVGNFE